MGMFSRRVWVLSAVLALVLAGCGDDGEEPADDQAEIGTDDDADDAEDDTADVADDAAEDGDDVGDAAAAGDGACVLLDPDGLDHYFDVEDHELLGPAESDEGYEACQWSASGEGLSDRVYTATIMDWDDPRFGGQTGQEGFDAFMQARLEEDTTATFLERYGDDVDVDGLELVDDVAYTNELYVLSGDEVYRLEGDPRGAGQSGRLVDDGHFPAARP